MSTYTYTNTAQLKRCVWKKRKKRKIFIGFYLMEIKCSFIGNTNSINKLDHTKAYC